MRFREAQGQEDQESSDSAVENGRPYGHQSKGGGLLGRGMVVGNRSEGVLHMRGVVHTEANGQDHIDGGDGVNGHVTPVVKEAQHLRQGHGHAEANLHVDQS